MNLHRQLWTFVFSHEPSSSMTNLRLRYKGS
uniref:Uncharacterized protein n=1 Tax=Arundo donax TaxID=35708 RepID=A0A0A8XYG6_ARUDO